ncbi:unknown [Tannerella sp. CAG:118]|uniref:Uncharacterized protein n=1 Tax=Coprobacter secundus subsp. similis TaxID=2751153 RepID=A0A7G1HU29_9BACT|nr:hypothetical protein Cop2CBH44_16120 [Coprobacter secundus subsp. similis]CCY38653.1 unknown [Tannerella sp. CAG:118]
MPLQYKIDVIQQSILYCKYNCQHEAIIHSLKSSIYINLLLKNLAKNNI